MKRAPSLKVVAANVAAIDYYERTSLPWSDPRRVHEGGGALKETRREAESVRKWLRERGLGDDGKPLGDAPSEAAEEIYGLGYMQGRGAA